MTASYENEIVTLRSRVCLVRQLPKLPLIAKIAEIEKQGAHRGDAEARRRLGNQESGTAKQPDRREPLEARRVLFS